MKLLPLRTYLAVGLLAATAVLAVPGVAAQQDAGRLGVFVISVDGLRPQEVDAAPNLAAFRAESTWYAESRAVMVAETIPNHVAMMTGIYPDRSGIPANNYWNRQGEPDYRDLSDPAELEVPHLFTTLAAACPAVRTAAVLSKRYLHEVFQAGGVNRAPGFHWSPEPLIGDDLAPAPFTMDVALEHLPDSDFMFVNLGDVDRAGHFDFTGPGPVAGLRATALAETDAQVGRFIQALRAAGRWERSVVFVVSDHGFNWSLPPAAVTLTPDLPAGLFAVARGGSGHVYLVDRNDPDGPAKLKAARDLALSKDGVEAAWYRQPNPADPGAGTVMPADLRFAHENVGDLVVLSEPGTRLSDPGPQDNPIPGYHGNLATRHNTFMVGGGVPFLRGTRSIAASAGGAAAGPEVALPEQSENVDVAPTVAWLFGLPTGGYDGRVLLELFSPAVRLSPCGVLGATAVPPAPPGPAPAPAPAPPPGNGVLPSTGGPLPVAAGIAVSGLALLIVACRPRPATIAGWRASGRPSPPGASSARQPSPPSAPKRPPASD